MYNIISTSRGGGEGSEVAMANPLLPAPAGSDDGMEAEGGGEEAPLPPGQAPLRAHAEETPPKEGP